MSCGVAVGIALADLAIFLIASHATAVVLGVGVRAAAKAAERDRLNQLIQEAVQGGLETADLLSEQNEDEIHRMLEEAGKGPDFQDAEVIIRTGAGDIIGLKRDSEGIYQVVAKYQPTDVDRLRVDTDDVAEQWKQRYAYLKVKKEAEALGYQVVEEEILPDQSVRIRVRRWD